MIDILITRLDGPAADYGHLTYPRFRPILDQKPEGVPPVDHLPGKLEAFGANLSGMPIGLVVLQHLQKNKSISVPHTRILSVMVAREHRRHAIGQGLLDAAAERARALGSKQMVAQHSAQTKGRAAFEALLASDGWAAPELCEYRLAGQADWTERVAKKWRPMLERIRRQGYSHSPWKEISKQDRQDAEAVVDAGMVHPNLGFANFEPHCDPALSIALRYQGKLVGWVIGETPPGTGYHHYTCGHVRPDLQQKGWVIAGLHDVCVLQQEFYGPTSVAVYETFGANAPMINFMKRRLAGVTLWTDERFQSTKTLVSG